MKNMKLNQALPEPNALNETMWLDLYSDGELGETEKIQLFDYLDGSNGWRRCALHLSHERTLATEMKRAVAQQDAFKSNSASSALKTSTQSAVQSISQANKQATKRSTDRLWASILAAGLAFLLGAGSVWFLLDDKVASKERNAKSTDQHRSLDDEKAISPVMKLTSHRPAESSLTFFEIEDTPVHATYYLQKPLPALFLQALVLAGHSVEINQEMMAIEDADGNTSTLPINILEIKKHINISF